MADSNCGSMVLHIVQMQFIEKHGGSYSGVRLEEEWGIRTSPTVATIGEQIYNIPNKDEERIPFPLTEDPTTNTKRY